MRPSRLLALGRSLQQCLGYVSEVPHFGRGTIDCGPGYDVLTLAKSDEHAYTVTNCEVIRIGYP